MTNNKEGLEILRFLYTKRKGLIIVTTIAGLISILVTWNAVPLFKSTASVFPPGFNSSDRMLENPQFGYNIEADRLIQIGESMDFRDSIINTFNLKEYYGINENKKDWRSDLIANYTSEISFERTKYMSVQINVLNRDPEMAADMVNEMIALLSRFWERIFKENMIETFNYSQKMYLDKQKEVSSMLDSIHALRTRNSDESMEKLHQQLNLKEKEVERNLNTLSNLRSSSNFYNYESRMDILSEEIIRTNRIIELQKGKIQALESANSTKDSSYVLAQGRYNGAIAHKEKLDKDLISLEENGKKYDEVSEDLENNLHQYNMIKVEYEKLLYSFEPLVQSVDLDFLESRYRDERMVLNELKRKLEKAHRFYNEPLPNLFVIDSARPIYKKASPSYLINFSITVAAALIVTIFTLLISNGIQKLRQDIEA